MIGLVDFLEGDLSARVGKFVLISQSGRYFLLRSSPKVCEYHAQIVAAFAERHDLPISLLRDGSDLARPCEAIELHGGGYWEYRDDRRLRLYAKSTAFGPFDQSLLRGLGLDTSLDWFIDAP